LASDVSEGKGVKLVVTVDTEEDNWGSVRRTHYTCENIARIPALQELFDHFNVTPTYLITYPVATDDQAASTLRAIADAQRCEIGAQCHPWNTPPFNEENTVVNSMLCNLPAASQYAKMKCLHEAIRTRFCVEPIAFKSGRFGYNTSVAQNLHRLGYKIDTSITPYMDWTGNHGPRFTSVSPRPFRFSSENAFQECASGDLVEVPSTIGFLQPDFVQSNYIFNAVTWGPISKLRLAGVLCRLRLLNKAWLSPELSDSRTMIRLARAVMRNGYGALNVMFHSPSLMAGLTPFTRSECDERRLVRRLREFLVFARDAGIQPMRLSDVLHLV
jgi:hypothetical protein